MIAVPPTPVTEPVKQPQEPDEPPMKKPDNANSGNGWGAEVWEKTVTDLLSIPFFAMWSVFLCAGVEYASNTNLNKFFTDALGEGIALKTMILLVLASVLSWSIGWIFNPSPSGYMMKILSAPSRAGRTICMSTGAFIIGAVPVLGYSTCAAQAFDLLLSVVAAIFAVWFLLLVIETMLSEAHSIHNGCSGGARVMGVALLVMSCFIMCHFYHQILAGEFLQKEPTHKQTVQCKAN